MSSALLPSQAAELLDWWLPRIRGILEPHLRCVVLFGSAAIGGYTPGRSDVDVCMAVDGGVPERLARPLATVHDAMREHFVACEAGRHRYRYVIEGHYIPPQIMADTQAAGDCFVAWGRTRKWARGNPVTPFDRYSLWRHGICVFGESIRIAPPSRAELAGQLKLDLCSLTDPPEECLRSPGWLTSMITWVARSMVFWRDGRLMAKTAALEHEIRLGSPFADVYSFAIDQRRRETAGQPSDEILTGQMRDLFRRIAAPAAAQLRELAADCLPDAADVRPW